MSKVLETTKLAARLQTFNRIKENGLTARFEAQNGLEKGGFTKDEEALFQGLKAGVTTIADFLLGKLIQPDLYANQRLPLEKNSRLAQGSGPTSLVLDKSTSAWLATIGTPMVKVPNISFDQLEEGPHDLSGTALSTAGDIITWHGLYIKGGSFQTYRYAEWTLNDYCHIANIGRFEDPATVQEAVFGVLLAVGASALSRLGQEA